MKNFLMILVCVFIGYGSWACNNSTINSVSPVDNGNGTTTYTINVTNDVGGSDGYDYGFALIFNSSAGTPVVQTGFTSGFTPSSSTYGPLTGYIGNDIGSGASDNFTDPRYNGQVNVLTYETDSNFGFSAGDYTVTVVVTIQGCVEEIVFDGDFRANTTSVTPPVANCVKTFDTGVNCNVVCSIDNVSIGTQSPCVPSTDTYTQEITVTYTNPPSTGTLDINGQSFTITTSPQTEVLTGLPANGAVVNFTAQFSDDTGCSDTGSFTAPVSCASTCNPNNGNWAP